MRRPGLENPDFMELDAARRLKTTRPQENTRAQIGCLLMLKGQGSPLEPVALAGHKQAHVSNG